MVLNTNMNTSQNTTPNTNQQNNPVISFMEITKCDVQTANVILQRNKMNLDNAISDF